MKGKARKIGRPPPGDPPAPAAEALAPVGRGRGRLRLRGILRRRPPRSGLRLSRVVPRGGRCAAVRRALARGDRAHHAGGGERRGRAAALGAEGDSVAGRGGDRRRDRSGQGRARRRCAFVLERDIDRPFGRSAGGGLRSQRLRRCLDGDRGNRDTDVRRRHGDRRESQASTWGPLDRRQRDGARAGRDRNRRLGHGTVVAGAREPNRHICIRWKILINSFAVILDLNFRRSSRSMSTSAELSLL